MCVLDEILKKTSYVSLNFYIINVCMKHLILKILFGNYYSISGYYVFRVKK